VSETPTLRMKLENILTPMEWGTEDLAKKERCSSMSKTGLKRDKSQRTKQLPLEGLDGGSKTQSISVCWELRDFVAEDDSTHSEGNASSPSSRNPEMKPIEKKQEPFKVYFELSGEEVYI